jgi:hypothetical protein
VGKCCRGAHRIAVWKNKFGLKYLGGFWISLPLSDVAAKLVARTWMEILAGTAIAPIDIHTPLWLWSRSGFIPIAYRFAIVATEGTQ